MSSITLEQALYECPDNAPPRRLAHSPGFTALWMADAEHLVLGFGERTPGRRCPLAVFAQPIGPKHVAVARVRDVGVRARSEARESYHAYRTAYDLARHYRDEVLPLRRFIGEETVLRYNGMLASVWELLADSRAQVLAVNGAIEAQRDFWLAEIDLQTALTGTAPGARTGTATGSPAADGAAGAGH